MSLEEQKKRKRKCVFHSEYSEEFKFIKPGKHCHEAFCGLCNSSFTISSGGKSAIIRHIENKTHIKNASSLPSSSIGQITNYTIKKDTLEEDKIIAAEDTLAFHKVFHHHSFSSNDCVSTLAPTIFPDSKIASKISNARTKCTAIVKNVLAPHTVSEAVKDINESSFYGVSTDASNHKAEKIFPLIVQYFSKVNGLQIKLLSVKSLPNETSDTISNFCSETVVELGMNKNNCVAFGGDNTNTNFGGQQRRGKCNVYTKLKESMNGFMAGAGCPAHILHNAAQTAADVLSVDIEVIVMKIFSYFSIYTVRTERLKDFCDFVGINYEAVLSHSKTRWLSLINAVERIITIFEALKSYFNSEEKPPKILIDFFNNPLSEAYLFLIHSFQYLLSTNIKKIEKRENSVIEVLSILNDLVKCVKEKMDVKFIPLSVRSCLSKDEITNEQKTKFKLEVEDYYSTCHGYIMKWVYSLDEFKTYTWMLLKSNIPPAWDNVESSCVVLKEKGIKIDDNKLFCQWSSFKTLLEQEIQRDPEE